MDRFMQDRRINSVTMGQANSATHQTGTQNIKAPHWSGHAPAAEKRPLPESLRIRKNVNKISGMYPNTDRTALSHFSVLSIADL